MKTTKEQRDEWRKLARLATPGAWYAEETQAGPRRWSNARVRRVNDDEFIVEGRQGRPRFVDAELIAASRTAIPALLDDVDALTERMAKLEHALMRIASYDFDEPHAARIARDALALKPEAAR